MVSNLLQSEKLDLQRGTKSTCLLFLMCCYITVLAQYLPPLLTPLGTFWVLGELRMGGGVCEMA